MKTVKEWFEELPEPYKNEALKNQLTDHTVSSATKALKTGFVWSETPQGSAYWVQLYLKLR